MAADEARMIVGSLRGVVMMSPFYERPRSTHGLAPMRAIGKVRSGGVRSAAVRSAGSAIGSCSLGGSDQSDSTKRTPDGRVDDDTSLSAVFAADIAADPP